MYHPSVQMVPASSLAMAPARPACLVAGCPCKDARIVSHRRAAFFAALARRRGQTAERIVRPEAAWRLPSLDSLERSIRTAP
jgi:hypothetical protein